MALVKDNQKESAEHDRKVSSGSVLSDTEVFIIDPSEHFRPEHKSKDEYRIYTTNQVCIELHIC